MDVLQARQARRNPTSQLPAQHLWRKRKIAALPFPLTRLPRRKLREWWSLSSEEQAKAEQERRAEIAEKYSIYAPYGMTYDTEKDRFFYNGQVVRYFKDQISSNETNGFSYDDGVIDVEPIRDESGTWQV